MRRIIVALGLAWLCSPAMAESDQPHHYDWRRPVSVSADFNRSGQTDLAELGVSPDSVALRVTIDGKQLPLIEIPIDGSRQFGICPGSDPGMALTPHSEAPLNALGSFPQGYEVCEDCIGFVVSGGDCDSIYFYWDSVANALGWWRS